MLQATQEEKDLAAAALAKYDQLGDNPDRHRFIGMFKQQTLGKAGASGLKWVMSFSASLTHKDITSVGQVSDYMTPGQILTHNGRSFKDFESTEAALEDVMYLVKKSQLTHGYTEKDHPPVIDQTKPEYSQHWYIKSEGKRELWQQEATKRLDCDGGIMKSIGQMEQGMLFLEGTGFQAGSSVTIENPKHALLTKEIDALKSSYLHHTHM